MTELEMEIQVLRREKERLRDKLQDLENIHQHDLAEIMKLRRQIERYEEAGK